MLALTVSCCERHKRGLVPYLNVTCREFADPFSLKKGVRQIWANTVFSGSHLWKYSFQCAPIGWLSKHAQIVQRTVYYVTRK